MRLWKPSECIDGQSFLIQLENDDNTTTTNLHFYTDAAAGLCSDALELPFVMFCWLIMMIMMIMMIITIDGLKW